MVSTRIVNMKKWNITATLMILVFVLSVVRSQDCAKGFYLSDGKCTKCDCEEETSDSYECDRRTGQCKCTNSLKYRHGGRRCDRCKPGYAYTSHEPSHWCIEGCLNGYYETDNECKKCPTGKYTLSDGANEDYGIVITKQCSECNCDERGSKTKDCLVPEPLSMFKSKFQCTCKRGYHGLLCEKCFKGFFRDSDGLCKQCLKGYFRDDAYEESEKCKKCDCSIYACDPVNGECLCPANKGGRACEDCRLGYVKDINNQDCKKCGPLETSDVNPRIVRKRCIKCGCKPGNSVSCGYDEHKTTKCFCKAGFVGWNCGSCKPSYEKKGRKCEKCRDGEWSSQTHSSCEKCKYCSSTGTLTKFCNKSTGLCDCKKGATGENCTFCSQGYMKDKDGNCIECPDGRWSPLEANSGTPCRKCSCSRNKIADQICNKTTGHCNCRPKYKGKKCEDCFGFPAGKGPKDCEKRPGESSKKQKTTTTAIPSPTSPKMSVHKKETPIGMITGISIAIVFVLLIGGVAAVLWSKRRAKTNYR